MRNAALAGLSLLVLGLLATNTRLRAGNRLLEERVAAGEKNTRVKPVAPVETPADPIAPASVATPVPDPDPAPAPRVDAVALAKAETTANHRAVFTEPMRADDVYLRSYEVTLQTVSELAIDLDPLLDPPLTGTQIALIESLKAARDAELQPLQAHLREIEKRYEEAMERVLTLEQLEQKQLQKRLIRLGTTVYWKTQDER